jgi:hypothetical protein
MQKQTKKKLNQIAPGLYAVSQPNLLDMPNLATPNSEPQPNSATPNSPISQLNLQPISAIPNPPAERHNTPAKRSFITIDKTRYLDRSACELKSAEDNNFLCGCGTTKQGLGAWRQHLAKRNRQKRRRLKLEQFQQVYNQGNISADCSPQTVPKKGQ